MSISFHYVILEGPLACHNEAHENTQEELQKNQINLGLKERILSYKDHEEKRDLLRQILDFNSCVLETCRGT